MSANEIIAQIDKLPSKDQEQVFTFLADLIIHRREPDAKRWLDKKLSFEEACDVVFRENRELFKLLAK